MLVKTNLAKLNELLHIYHQFGEIDLIPSDRACDADGGLSLLVADGEAQQIFAISTNVGECEVLPFEGSNRDSWPNGLKKILEKNAISYDENISSDIGRKLSCLSPKKVIRFYKSTPFTFRAEALYHEGKRLRVRGPSDACLKIYIAIAKAVLIDREDITDICHRYSTGRTRKIAPQTIKRASYFIIKRGIMSEDERDDLYEAMKRSGWMNYYKEGEARQRKWKNILTRRSR